MSDFMDLARRGIRRFETFASGLDSFEKQRAEAEPTSMAAAAVPNPLFVSGVVDREDSERLYFTAVGDEVSARASWTRSGGAQVSVHSNFELRSIEMNQAVITTSAVHNYQHTGELAFVLNFAWGIVVVDRHNGTLEERASWLAHFTKILANSHYIPEPPKAAAP